MNCREKLLKKKDILKSQAQKLEELLEINKQTISKSQTKTIVECIERVIDEILKVDEELINEIL